MDNILPVFLPFFFVSFILFIIGIGYVASVSRKLSKIESILETIAKSSENTAYGMSILNKK
jgi:hypothetical protein